MAANNFSINLTDAGDQGSGPYTGVLLKNPTTVASGGTTVSTVVGTNLGLGDIVNSLMQSMRNVNAQVWDVDPLN